MNPTLGLLIAILIGFCLLVLPCIAAQYIVRRFGGSNEYKAVAGIQTLTCPKCGSPQITRLPGNHITPYPGYRCGRCELHMRPSGTGVFYVLIIAACFGLMALCTIALLEGGDADLYFVYLCTVVAGYSVYQLRRPTPQQSSVSSAIEQDD